MISIQEEDFDVGAEYELLKIKAGDAGAIVIFTGLVREIYSLDNQSAEPIKSLYLEHYPGMTEKSLQSIIGKANDKWPLLGTRIIHRIGELKPSDQIVFLGTSSTHRQNAFDAAQFIMDHLKSEAPFWKKQSSKLNSEWVESRVSDTDALDSWRDR
jgi:molybdopterin synthase catalytic subunit